MPSNETRADPSPGDLWCFRDKRGFGVLKVLATDQDGVHIRVWADRFEARPETITTKSLSLGYSPSGALAIGHLPLSRASFATWDADRVGYEPVTESELEGYRDWQDAKGGYW